MPFGVVRHRYYAATRASGELSHNLSQSRPEQVVMAVGRPSCTAFIQIPDYRCMAHASAGAGVWSID
jgi:hypothetical protein